MCNGSLLHNIQYVISKQLYNYTKEILFDIPVIMSANISLVNLKSQSLHTERATFLKRASGLLGQQMRMSRHFTSLGLFVQLVF